MYSMKYHILTLGCQMNKSDSERVRTVIEGMGYQWTEKEEEANLIGIIGLFGAAKINRQGIFPHCQVEQMEKQPKPADLCFRMRVTGRQEKFLKLFDLVFTMSELPDLPDMIRQYGVVSPSSFAGQTCMWQPHAMADFTHRS